MKLPLFLLFYFSTAVALLCAPPPTVTGMRFWTYTPGFQFLDSTNNEMLLNADGTYTGLRSYIFRQMNLPGGTSGGTDTPVLVDITIPPNGTWAYRLVDQTSAEMTLDGTPLLLHFDSDQTGRFGTPNRNKISPAFRFTPYNASTRLINCSTRTYLAPGRTVTLGFVITEGDRRVLIRAVGPGLRTFGVSQPLANPVLNVYDSKSHFWLDYDIPPATPATLNVAAQRAGAFPLPSIDDRGKYLTLTEGAYTVEVTARDNQSSGEVLIEVYQLP